MEPQSPLGSDNPEKCKTFTYRVRGIPARHDTVAAQAFFEIVLKTQDVYVDSLVPSPISRQGQVATIRVANSAKLPVTQDEWRIPYGPRSERMLAIDVHFRGFTPLYSPASGVQHSLECIAISGLGSHAFGSWKDRGSHYMWLRDALPHDIPGARILTYGYDTRLAESNSFQSLEDVASTFRVSLRIALNSRPPDRPLIFIAHSLGGLILKQALIQMASGDDVDKGIFQSTYGILFFGVPNQGMDISSLLAMVGDNPNLPFLTMLSKDSGILGALIERFRTVFDFKDSEIISFYETYASRTARKDATGKWSMSGDYTVLVDRYSARSGRSWEESYLFLQPINRNHSDMVKFSEYDDAGGIVSSFLMRFAKIAPTVIKKRIESLGSFPSDARPSAFRSRSLGEQAETEQSKRPIEARLRTSNLGDDTGQQWGANDRSFWEYELGETRRRKANYEAGRVVNREGQNAEKESLHYAEARKKPQRVERQELGRDEWSPNTSHFALPPTGKSDYGVMRKPQFQLLPGDREWSQAASFPMRKLDQNIGVFKKSQFSFSLGDRDNKAQFRFSPGDRDGS